MRRICLYFNFRFELFAGNETQQSSTGLKYDMNYNFMWQVIANTT